MKQAKKKSAPGSERVEFKCSSGYGAVVAVGRFLIRLSDSLFLAPQRACLKNSYGAGAGAAGGAGAGAGAGAAAAAPRLTGAGCPACAKDMKWRLACVGW
jgi:hypothetical protein